jgi:hypothetical protein
MDGIMDGWTGGWKDESMKTEMKCSWEYKEMYSWMAGWVDESMNREMKMWGTKTNKNGRGDGKI